MKIVTLNILHGGGGRGSARPMSLVSHLIKSDADVFVLTEARQSFGTEAILSQLNVAGWAHQILGVSVPRKNGIALASRLPVEKVPTSFASNVEARRFVEVKIEWLCLTGVLFPLRKEKLPYFLEVRQLLESRASSDDPHLLIGDFNTGDKVDAEGTPFHLGDQFRALSDTGYVDVWRSRHPNDTEYSWYSNAGNGFRIDHAFASPSLASRVVEARYEHAPRLQNSTDHSMLVVHIE